MADWPKHLLEKADTVTVASEDHVWKMTGAEMVGCLEAAGWIFLPPVRASTLPLEFSWQKEDHRT